jgi:Zn-dependent peptidase ImmA (M78 family)
MMYPSSTRWLIPLCDPEEAIADLLDCSLKRLSTGDSVILGLVKEVSARRAKPIVLMPIQMQGLEQFGCWLTDEHETHDFIFFEVNAAVTLQEHTILHELGHILLGHKTQAVCKETVVTDLILERNAQRDTPEEREAEQLANLIRNAIFNRVGVEALTEVSSTPLWSDLISGLALE